MKRVKEINQNIGERKKGKKKRKKKDLTYYITFITKRLVDKIFPID